jgi:hypothetical protein
LVLPPGRRLPVSMNRRCRSAVLSSQSFLPSPAAVARYHCSPTCTGVELDAPPQPASARAASAAVNVPIALVKVSRCSEIEARSPTSRVRVTRGRYRPSATSWSHRRDRARGLTSFDTSGESPRASAFHSERRGAFEAAAAMLARFGLLRAPARTGSLGGALTVRPEPARSASARAARSSRRASVGRAQTR